MFQEIRDALNGTYRRHARANAIAGLTTGLLIGAIAGLLFAPKSGKETRADIREGAKLGAEKVKEAAHNLSDLTKEKFAEVKERLKGDCCCCDDDETEVEDKDEPETV
jgi:gas vesicle protein